MPYNRRVQLGQFMIIDEIKLKLIIESVFQENLYLTLTEQLTKKITDTILKRTFNEDTAKEIKNL